VLLVTGLVRGLGVGLEGGLEPSLKVVKWSDSIKVSSEASSPSCPARAEEMNIPEMIRPNNALLRNKLNE
jgi:hypothetical protein